MSYLSHPKNHKHNSIANTESEVLWGTHIKSNHLRHTIQIESDIKYRIKQTCH